MDISELLNDGSDQRAASSNLLVDFVNSLDSTTRATSKQQQQQRKRKQAEPDEERESALLTTSGSVSLSMLAGLAGATEGGDLPGGHLGKRIKQIYRGEGKSEAVSAPLAPALQQRIERETAYDASAREVSKWMPIVAKNRQAEHLEFPLNVTSKQTLSSASLASTFKVGRG